LEFVEIYPDILFAVKFKEEDQDEYARAFSLWQDLDYLVEYFSRNKHLLESSFWKSSCIPNEVEDLAQQVIDESFDLEEYIDKIAENTIKGDEEDFDSFFKELGGKYNILREYIPHKSYGTNSPTMLRLYAIRIKSNCYLIVHGGIKLTKEIQGTPELNSVLFAKIDRVISYLKAEGVIDETDLIE